MVIAPRGKWDDSPPRGLHVFGAARRQAAVRWLWTFFQRLHVHLAYSRACHDQVFGEHEEDVAPAADNSIQHLAYQEMAIAALGDDLADLRYNHHTAEAHIDRMKVVFARWLAAATSFIRAQLLLLSSRLVDAHARAELDGILECATAPLHRLRTQTAERAHMNRRMPCIRMRTHSYGTNHTNPSTGVQQSDLVEIPVQATLERILQNDAFLRKTILASSDLFKSSSLHGADPPDTLRDITDGSAAR